MEEKDMVLDVLSGTKASLGTYSTVITECNDPNLRQTFQQMRDGGEKFQYELYKIANQKGYYKTPAPAPADALSKAKSSLTEAATRAQGAGPIPTMN